MSKNKQLYTCIRQAIIKPHQAPTSYKIVSDKEKISLTYNVNI